MRAIVWRSEAGGRGSASEEHDLADSCPTSAGREKVRKLPVSSYPPFWFCAVTLTRKTVLLFLY